MKLDIHIPHLGFAVYVRPRPKNWTSYASTLYSNDGYSVKLILPDDCTPSSLAHELVHVLQAICARYTMNFKDEKEHTAYLMQWLMEKIRKAQRATKRRRSKNGNDRRHEKLQVVRRTKRSDQKIYGRVLELGEAPIRSAPYTR